MVRETGSKQRRVRRLGALPGLTSKISNRQSTPGEKNSDKQKAKKKRKTQFGIRLEEKQKIRFNYGISDTQLINYVKEAKKNKASNRKSFTTFSRNAVGYNNFSCRVSANNSFSSPASKS